MECWRCCLKYPPPGRGRHGTDGAAAVNFCLERAVRPFRRYLGEMKHPGTSSENGIYYRSGLANVMGDE